MINDIIASSEYLIRLNTVEGKSEQFDKGLNYCQRLLSEFKNSRIYRSQKVKSLLISNKTNTNKFKLILNAHLDVVPAKSSQFIPKIIGNRLYGRGAYDMKTSLATCLWLFKTYAKQVSYPFALQIVTDEEVGGFNGTYYQLQQGISSEFTLSAEPTDLKINHEAKGILWVKLTALGKEAHGAHPWDGINAVEIMHKLLQTVKHIYPTPIKALWKTTVNIANITTNNTSLNKVPATCTANLDIRYIPTENPDVIINKIKSTIPKNSQVTIDVILKEPPLCIQKTNTFVRKLKKLVLQETNHQSIFLRQHGGSDVRHFMKNNIIGVCFGPVGAGLHTENEWVDLKQLPTYTKIMSDFIKSI
jgi:succinyl-diaminopimelate desuccinylase